jgi:hypothetical protein
LKGQKWEKKRLKGNIKGTRKTWKQGVELEGILNE